ncbi:MAG: glycerol-3-phosphate 1-O-acyltransferase PlsY [Candidatus Margulisiibacteriota bacterium]
MFFILLVICYFLGSIPFGFIIAKMWGVDVRTRGSGNIGATNVLRTVGAFPGALALILDVLKGTGAVLLAKLFFGDPALIILCGLAAVLGHSFSIFLKFKGGKSVATGIGILLGIAPEIFLFTVLIFIISLLLCRYVSVSSITASIIAAVSFFILGKPVAYSVVVSLIAALIILRHIPNVKRVIAGNEPKIGEKK